MANNKPSTWDILREGVVLLAALAVLMMFACLMSYLLLRADTARNTEWTRYTYLLSGVEAIVFAAAGFLFGKEVNRVRAEQAETTAKDAQTSAAKAQANGLVLKEIISSMTTHRALESEETAVVKAAQIDLDYAVKRANELFPG